MGHPITQQSIWAAVCRLNHSFGWWILKQWVSEWGLEGGTILLSLHWIIQWKKRHKEDLFLENRNKRWWMTQNKNQFPLFFSTLFKSFARTKFWADLEICPLRVWAAVILFHAWVVQETQLQGIPQWRGAVRYWTTVVGRRSCDLTVTFDWFNIHRPPSQSEHHLNQVTTATSHQCMTISVGQLPSFSKFWNGNKVLYL